MVLRPLRFIAAASFVLAMPVWPVAAENRGEYGRAEVEVDRSVLQDLKGYQPPPMFQQAAPDAPSDQAAPSIPPPDKVILTAPKTEDLLQHPVENRKVLTLQGSMVKGEIPTTDLPVPGETKPRKAASTSLSGLAASSSVPPLPPHKPGAVTAQKSMPPRSSEESAPNPVSSAVKAASETPDQSNGPLLPMPPPGVMAAPGELAAPSADAAKDITLPPRKPIALNDRNAPPIEDTKAPVAANAPDKTNDDSVKTSSHYRPKTPKTMPAVPPIQVEAKPIPSMANMPPIDGEAERPTAGELMMDDALTRNMVKNDKDVKAALGIKEEPVRADAEAMDQFSIAFKNTDIELKQEDRKLLDRTVIKRLSSDSKYRVQIRSYASRSDGSESSARRTSLSRALVVRSYLLTKGIQPTRIDVRALSDQTQEQPLDRIDMSLIGPNS